MFSKFSVKKPYTVFVAVIMVLILGAVSFINLQTDLLPSMDLPYVVVMTPYPGASPEEVEMVVTSPIEQVVATTSNIKNINSISSENSSTVILEFNNDVNMDSAIIEINGSLDMIKGMWSNSIGTPMVIRLNPDMLPVMISTVDVKDMDIVEVSKMVSQDIIPALESVNGVASVSGMGLIEEKVEVEISSEKIDKLNQKILGVIDSNLSEVEDQLLQADQEIESGRRKLEEENISQGQKLAEGEKAIALGREQIEQGLAGIDVGLLELENQKEELILGIQEISQFEHLSNEKLQLEEGLLMVEAQITNLEAEKESILEKKNELEIQEKQIVEGKSILTSEINKARVELNKGEEALKAKKEEFKKGREEAFENASLDGVITTEMISGILAAQNFSMPAGYVKDDGTDYLVKIGDKIKDIDEMKGLLLFDTGIDEVGKVYLKDVANIDIVDNSKDIYTKVNGNDAVVLVFQKQSNFSTADVAGMIRDKFDEIMEKDSNVTMTALMDQGIYIDIVVNSVLQNILYGGILAILVLILFLRDIKPTIVIAISIPISIVFAIAMMYFTGVTINVISLAGLALGVGMLVDNSIVVIENIYRLRNEGVSAAKAAVEGAREVSGAILASTLTTACVFLPIVFVQGISKTLFVDMGLTIAYSLFASLIVALTVVPSMGSVLLKSTSEKEDKIFNGFVNTYEKVLEWSLNHKAIVMIFVVGLLGFSGFLASKMGTSFIPEMDAGQMSLSLELDKESSFEETANMSNTVIDRIMEIEDIETIGALQGLNMGGMMAGGGGGTNTMSMYLVLDENRSMSNIEIEREIIKLTDDLDATITVSTSDMDMSALAGSGIEVMVKGRDLDTLQEIGLDISKLLEETEGTTMISTGEDEGISEMRIAIDKEKAMEKGLTVAQVFGQVSDKLAGEKTATTLSVGNKDYPVIIVDNKKDEILKGDLESLLIDGSEDGEEAEIALEDISVISEESGLKSIKRTSQERYISITSDIDIDHNIGLVSRDFERKLEGYTAPEGYTIELSGENEMIRNSLEDLVKMVLLAIVFIYLIMVAQFQSLLFPFIVMFTIPLAFTGGLLALAITGFDISLIAMLGFLVLSGIVVNNGIVFVDFTNQLMESGIEKREALLLTGKTRIRPILMTALTTILGLFTLSLGVGEGAEMLQPLAIVAIGGLTYATILTLFVVPVMYDILHRKKSNVTGQEGRE